MTADPTPAESGPPSDRPLTTLEFKSRLRDYGLNTLNPIVTMMMSGVFATAALAFADIMRNPSLRWVRLSIWVLLATTSSLSIIRSTNANLLFTHPRAVHSVYQLAYAFIFSTAFACLPESTGGEDGWLFALTLPFLMSLMLIFLVLPGFRRWVRPEHFDRQLHGVISKRLESASPAAQHVAAFFAVLYFAVLVECWYQGAETAPWCYLPIAWCVVLSAFLVTVTVREFESFQDMVDAVDKL